MEPSIKPTLSKWADHEKPRERLFSQGASVLSDAELLGILFRSGLPGKDAIQLSRELLIQFGSLRKLLAASQTQLLKTRGLGPAKISSLMACQEIAKRILRENVIGAPILCDPQMVMEYLYLSMRDRTTEVFKMIYLDKGNKVLYEEDLFEGTIDQTVVHVREVVKSALERHAAAVILVHNHPSGRTQPSIEDRAITGKIKTALATVGIQLLDHFIIGEGQFFSFKEHGLIS